MAEDKHSETDDWLVSQESDQVKLGDESDLSEIELSYEASSSGANNG